jgi:hypothetical protein
MRAKFGVHQSSYWIFSLRVTCSSHAAGNYAPLPLLKPTSSVSQCNAAALVAMYSRERRYSSHQLPRRLRGCLPEFVNAYWNSPLGITSIAQVAVTTAGLYSLSTQKIARIPVPVPPLEEQREIVRRIGALFKLADLIEKRVVAASSRAGKLSQAILAKAFRGELVPTEAELARREGREYEPASVLLERIKAETTKARAKTRPKYANRRAAAATN